MFKYCTMGLIKSIENNSAITLENRETGVMTDEIIVIQFNILISIANSLTRLAQRGPEWKKSIS